MKRINLFSAVSTALLGTTTLALGLVLSNLAVAGNESAPPRLKAASELTWADMGIGPVAAAPVQGGLHQGRSHHVSSLSRRSEDVAPYAHDGLYRYRRLRHDETPGVWPVRN